jgi:hypothetical protein
LSGPEFDLDGIADREMRDVPLRNTDRDFPGAVYRQHEHRLSSRHHLTCLGAALDDHAIGRRQQLRVCQLVHRDRQLRLRFAHPRLGGFEAGLPRVEIGLTDQPFIEQGPIAIALGRGQYFLGAGRFELGFGGIDPEREVDVIEFGEDLALANTVADLDRARHDPTSHSKCQLGLPMSHDDTGKGGPVARCRRRLRYHDRARSRRLGLFTACSNQKNRHRSNQCRSNQPGANGHF